MSDDKKNIGPEVETSTEAPAPGQPAPGKAETVVTEPVPGEKTASAEKAKPAAPESPGAAAPEQPQPNKADKQTAAPGRDDPAPVSAGKVVDFAAAREETGKTTSPAKEAKKPEQPRRGRPPKGEKPKRDKMSQSKAPAPKKEAAAPTEPEQPVQPRDATRDEKEEIVYLNLSELHPFKNHPFGVRDDAEMQGLVESVKAAGINQPALVRPREDGGYEIIAGHRRQRASELAGFVNMPCIVRNMTDDEASLAMTDDNLRHRERILPTEKAAALKQQVEAIKHQGDRLGEDDKNAGKRSTQIVGDRNGMNYKHMQR